VAGCCYSLRALSSKIRERRQKAREEVSDATTMRGNLEFASLQTFQMHWLALLDHSNCTVY
jgi:hypothetical protein